MSDTPIIFDSPQENNSSPAPLFQMIGGTLYVSNDAMPADYFRHIKQQLEILGDKPDAQNSRLWTETVNYVYTVCELALEAVARGDGGES